MKCHTYTYAALFTLICSSNRGGETFSRVVYECVKSVCVRASPFYSYRDRFLCGWKKKKKNAGLISFDNKINIKVASVAVRLRTGTLIVDEHNK